MDCACLVITANIPLQLPINRTLALSLPRACNMSGVPVQCKASGTPLPAPGPVLLGPTLAPMDDSPLSPQASKASAFAPATESDTTMDLTPAFPPLPTTTSSGGVRPVLTPSPSASSHISPPAIMLAIVAAQQVQNAVAEDKQDPSFKERFKACYNECHGKCTSKGSSSTYCEVKCDASCGASEAAAKLGINLGD
ncbi:hypothetical protein Dsin_025056 [Dipteronia sinensis]|uniref:Bifunctional inhibitor/plant lipid transfer protein/seed storage helical domain-containing protein n=1 Tax=Dipteronia sinensis TaxID=43782 RepID=A0AAD9ZVN7_9ROSI|nr:hypothetical protein Dsin_025056 [Dipteronia sinensis]